MTTYWLGIDIGGTFTDFVLLAGEDNTIGQLVVAKRLTTPDDPSVGAIDGATQVLEDLGLSLAEVEFVIHGTTLVANAIIERKGVRTGLITTEGFRDLLDMRELRYDINDLSLEVPEPLVPPDLRVEVCERVLHDGTVETALTLDRVRHVVQVLVDAGVTSVAVCMLHSYINPTHELAVRDLLATEFPELWVSVSSEVWPDIREFPRVSTVVANAYVQPLIDRYLANMVDGLFGCNSEGKLHIMLSSGGTTSVKTARAHPVRLIESGPAAGAVAAAYFGKLIGNAGLVSFDMGGTTAKICMIDRGEPSHSMESEVARLHRFKQGSGLLIRSPTVQLLEIGAGGGSIASLDMMGLLKVGPESAGALPGPACYGLGGSEPTVTDADLLLGYLNADWFLGGVIALDLEAARRAINDKIADPLGIDVVEAASGIIEVVNSSMANATRLHVAERGYDPRQYALFVFGGAGPVHGEEVARLLGMRKMICPLSSGAFSAFGLLVAPGAFNFVRTYVTRFETIDWPRVVDMFSEMESRGRQMLRSLGIQSDHVLVTRSAEMRYVRQESSVGVALPDGLLTREQAPVIRQAFYESYRQHYGHHLPDVPFEVVTWHLQVASPQPWTQLDVMTEKPNHRGTALKGERDVYFLSEHDFLTSQVYDWYGLQPTEELEGPAVVEARETTAVFGPGSRIRVDHFRNLVADLRG
ncbi:MAG: hydantoinase/oxoprolinase family protein [bacterium]